MLENFDANTPNQDESTRGTVSEYLKRAASACDDGDVVLGIHLYLTAFEESVAGSAEPTDEALAGLRRAWALACDNKERSLAGYIFEKMQPYLSQTEVAVCAEELQSLAFEALGEMGLSDEELGDLAEIEDAAKALARELFGPDSNVVKVEHIIERPASKRKTPQGEAPSDVAVAASDEGAGEHGSDVVASADDSASSGEDSSDEREPAAVNVPSLLGGAQEGPLAALARAVEESGVRISEPAEVLNYRTLAGYNSTIRMMRDIGIGLQGDAQFNEFVDLLNARHGLDRMPALDTLMFRSPAREDANRFVAATVGELGLPVVRMYMEENLQGLPLLCVAARADEAGKGASLRNVFDAGGVLVLENVDMWSSPLAETSEETNGLLALQLSRGAREAIALIRSAVDSPDVYVLATASTDSRIDDYFLDLIEPLSVIDIDYPTPEERVEIWLDIAREHPSLRGVNRADLVRLSANMPRYDMYMAAREAVEEAYKLGLVTRHYQPVTRDNLFDKIAAYQPLDSREYHELEEAVIRDFRADLSHIDDLLRGE